MSEQQMKTGVAALLDSLSKLFDARALIAERNFNAHLKIEELGRKAAYEDAARETRLLAEKLRDD